MGGLLALRLALADPDRVSALVLSDSAGLGREVSPVLASATLPGAGEAAISLVETPMGAAQRVWARTPLLFTLSAAAPPEWLAEQYRLALTPGFMEATLAALRGHIDPVGQREREVLLDELPRIEAPTLVVWGGLDKVVPTLHARDAVSRLRRGHLEIIPGCGHLPHAERPDRFAHTLNRFLDGERNGSHA